MRFILTAALLCAGITRPCVLETAAGPFPPELRWRGLAGTAAGLYAVGLFGNLVPLRTGGEVRKIVRTGDGWFTLGDEGILFSRDLFTWESRNRGLPEKTLKLYRDGITSLEKVVQEIKDLEVNPFGTDIMVCATKDTVFLSRDAGRSWQSLGMPSYRTNGIKAVAVTAFPRREGGRSLVVFMSHSTYGIHYLEPDRRGAVWTELNAGIETLETTGNADEVSDILPARSAVEDGAPVLYAAQTFRPRIYRLDWERRRFVTVWSGGAEFGTVDSLALDGAFLDFVREGEVCAIPRLDTGERGTGSIAAAGRRGEIERVRLLTGEPEPRPRCLGLWSRGGENGGAAEDFFALSELWLLDEAAPRAEDRDGAATADTPGAVQSPAPAWGREGIYLPANHAMDERLLARHLATIESRNLNMIVIDMKDDYGRFRFSPENPRLLEKGRVFRPVDIGRFLADMKARGVYTVARIVVFKDPELARRENGRYAVWDRRLNRPWRGYFDVRVRKDREQQNSADLETEILPDGGAEAEYEILRTFYDEQWVDPYSEEVWEYTALLAEELNRRGFDEIQFDYIRFPTDGQNLEDARYRWREAGMDMESAMLSFLRHIRSRLDCPLSADIYGANGWYRTGARTGQEVELMAPYIDVICPMYYPSHFEQNFLAQHPAEERPRRIYYQGTLRTARIGRGKVIVRPYVQAFYLNVSYDRQYYNTEYVLREVLGVRAAGGFPARGLPPARDLLPAYGGLTYWNNAGRYNDLPFGSAAAPEPAER
ncbi:MAG: hypothetical protein LBC88_03955 [Spirochaetaceae bacterium]|jgi:hypothetical protein|nr:hypothetical protein [Spirochaetaceae bacterium]